MLERKLKEHSNLVVVLSWILLLATCYYATQPFGFMWYLRGALRIVNYTW